MAQDGDPRVRQPRQLRPERDRGLRLRRAVGEQQQPQPGMGQGVDAAHPHPGGIAGLQLVGAHLGLRAGGLDHDLVAAERHRRRDRAHSRQRRQAQAQALVGADERALVDDRPAQRLAGEARQGLGGVAQRHVLGTEEHLHAARRGGRLAAAGGEREAHRTEAHAVGRALADHQVGGAEESGHELGRRPQVELVGRSLLEQPAEVHHRHPVRELEGLLLVVGDEQGGDPQLALDGANGAPQLEAHAGVERPERLVEQQHLRLVREGAGESDALLLPAGQLARSASAKAGQTDHLQQLVAAAAALGRLDAADAQGELDVLGRRHTAEQGIALEHEPDAAPGGWQLGDVAPVEQHPPGVHVGEAGDHAQQGALAAARGAEQHVELPGAGLQRDTVDHRMPGVALGEVLENDRHRRWRRRWR